MPMKIRVIKEKKDLHKEDRFFDKYHPNLTRKLDSFTEQFNDSVINEITLWKVKRHTVIPDETMNELNNVRNWKKRDKRKVENILILLLNCDGVGLPMASTYLRFRNPTLFQIIDQRVYRVIKGEKLKLPSKNSPRSHKELCRIYCEFLDELESLSSRLGIPFQLADRILFNADLRLNSKLKLSGYGSLNSR